MIHFRKDYTAGFTNIGKDGSHGQVSDDPCGFLPGRLLCYRSCKNPFKRPPLAEKKNPVTVRKKAGTCYLPPHNKAQPTRDFSFENVFSRKGFHFPCRINTERNFPHPSFFPVLNRIIFRSRISEEKGWSAPDAGMGRSPRREDTRPSLEKAVTDKGGTVSWKTPK